MGKAVIWNCNKYLPIYTLTLPELTIPLDISHKPQTL